MEKMTELIAVSDPGQPGLHPWEESGTFFLDLLSCVLRRSHQS